MPAVPVRPAPWLCGDPVGPGVEIAAVVLVPWPPSSSDLRIWTLPSSLPTYVWTRDSGSYVAPATEWLRSGQWITSPRRGPVYSLFLAVIFRAGGTLATVAARSRSFIGALHGHADAA